MTSSADKIAGAPISWGVCEVPGWGYQLPPERVLTEMQQVGLAATEFGPDGFLPADPAVMAELLAARHLTAVGGFTPVVLHEPGHDPVPGIDRLLDSYDASHADVLVLSAATGRTATIPARTGRIRLEDAARQPGPADRPGRRARRPRRPAPARRHHGRARRRGAAGAGQARPSRCAWTPATC